MKSRLPKIKLASKAVFGGIKRIAAVLIIVSMNWSGLAAVGMTGAHFVDTEGSNSNQFTAGILDIGATKDTGFGPEVDASNDATATATITKAINSADFYYAISTTGETGDLCAKLDLVMVSGANYDSGAARDLANFAYNPASISSGGDVWDLTASLKDGATGWVGKTCAFKVEFKGTQNSSGSGFFDAESLDFTVVAEAPSAYILGDAYVDQQYPSNNYGSDNSLKVESFKSSNPKYRNEMTFVQFGFNFPEETEILSAKLKLYMYDAPSSSRNYGVYRVNDAWTENSINYNNKPNSNGAASSVVGTGTSVGWLSWDVTDDVYNFLNGGSSNYGWEIRDENVDNSQSKEALFYSKEYSNSAYRPVLEITFAPAAVTTDHLVINEVYYDVADNKGHDPENEWVEVYNPTANEIGMDGMHICDSANCDQIINSQCSNGSCNIPAHGFGVISRNAGNTSTYWPAMPSNTVNISLNNSNIGYNGLNNKGDYVGLFSSQGEIIDEVNYGNTDSPLNPSVPAAGKGHSIARIVKGYDTDSAEDWIINLTPNPGTNPSSGGLEIMRFRFEGVEVASAATGLETLDGFEINEPLVEELPDATTTEEIVTSETVEQQLVEFFAQMDVLEQEAGDTGSQPANDSGSESLTDEIEAADNSNDGGNGGAATGVISAPGAADDMPEETAAESESANEPAVVATAGEAAEQNNGEAVDNEIQTNPAAEETVGQLSFDENSKAVLAGVIGENENGGETPVEDAPAAIDEPAVMPQESAPAEIPAADPAAGGSGDATE